MHYEKSECMTCEKIRENKKNTGSRPKTECSSSSASRVSNALIISVDQNLSSDMC